VPPVVADYSVGDAVEEIRVKSFTAGAAITKGQLVRLTADMTVGPAIADSDPIGAALTAVAAGNECPVAVEGIVCLKSGGAITRGKAVASDATGRVVMLGDQAVNEGGTATYTIYYGRKVGIALTATTAADQNLFVLLEK